MNTNLLKKVTENRHIARTGLQLKKYSPQILTGVGIAGLVTSTVMACKATTKLDDVLDQMDRRKDVLNKLRETETTEEDHKQHTTDNVAIHAKAALDIVKLYGPSFTLGLASIGCIIGAHGIMQKRNAALAIAYNAMEKSFTEYRKRVEEELGADQERDIRFNLSEEEVKDEETGKNKIVTDVGQGHSPYSRIFDELNDNWQKTPGHNAFFINCVQQNVNDLLRARGHVWLNEVYERLGFPHTEVGAVVGWVYDDPDGDSFIDFGLFDLEKEATREFINGHERSVILDFNVQGTILDKI